MIRNRFSAPRVLVAAFALALIGLVSPAAVHAAGPPSGFYYTVQYGDSLDSIAARFGMPVQSIMAANGMTSRYPYVGRSIYMPHNYGGQTYGGYAPSNSYFMYEVQRGDTLAGIAHRYGVSSYSLMSANRLYNPGLVYAHMRMYVPRSSYYAPQSYYGSQGYSNYGQTYQNYQTYIVQPGDTLSGIALRFGSSVYALEVANNIPNPNLIYSGMRLAITGYSSNGYAPSTGYPSGGYSPYGYAPAPGISGATPTPSAATTNPVTLMNIAYHPKAITVHVGSVVVWTNDDSGIQHTVTSGTPGAPSGTFDSGTLNTGQAYQFTFNAAGTYAYYCKIHGAAMTGTVNVVP
jgi:LysM repeat protein